MTQKASATLVLWIFSAFLLIWTLAIPPFQNADESAHYIKTCSKVIVEIHPVRGGYGHSYNWSMNELGILAQTDDVRTRAKPYSWEKFFSEPVDESEHWRFYPFAVPNTIAPYSLPHAACKLLTATSLPYQYIFYALRVSFALSFIALAYFTRRVNENLFMASAPLLMIPMVINQGAAISADYFSIGSTMLFSITIASMIRDSKVSKWTLAASIFLLWNAKIVYLPFTAILLIPMIKWREYRSFHYLTPAFVFGSAAGALQYYYQTSKSHFERNTELHTIQLQRLIDQPAEVLEMFVSTIAGGWVGLLHGAIGTAGWLTTPISSNTMWIAAATVLTWLIYGIARSIRSDKWHYFLLALGIFSATATMLGIYLSMYIFWTQPGSSTIDGVQGRYLIPLAFFVTPLIFSGVQDPKIHIKSLLACIVIAGTAASFLFNDVIPYFY